MYRVLRWIAVELAARAAVYEDLGPISHRLRELKQRGAGADATPRAVAEVGLEVCRDIEARVVALFTGRG